MRSDGRPARDFKPHYKYPTRLKKPAKPRQEAPLRWVDTAQPILECQAIDAQLCRRLTITFVGFYSVSAQRIQNVFRSHQIATFSSHVWSLSIQAKFPTVLIQSLVSNPLFPRHLDFRCSRCLFDNEQRNWGV